MTRIAPHEAPYPDGVGAQLASMMPPGAEPIALFRTFARNLPMTQAMGGWGRYELGRTLSLSMRDREIIIDRTCARCGCEYEWGVHIAFFATRVGFDPEHVTSLTHGSPDDACWTEPERLLIRAADQLHDHSDIDDALWSDLRRTYTETQMLDLTMLCGWYHAISFTARAARVANEANTPTFADVAG